MAKKTTLDDIARTLTTHGKEIRDLTATVAHVVKHMATKEDIAEVKATLDEHTKTLDEHTRRLNVIEHDVKSGLDKRLQLEVRVDKLEKTRT